MVLAIGVLLLVVAAVSARRLLFGSYRVTTSSMERTILIGELVLVSSRAYAKNLPRRGDIVVLSMPIDASRLTIKRVVGLPGDTLEIRSGNLIRNGVAVREPYAIRGEPIRQPDPAGEMPAMRIPPGRVFVLGDNRGTSYDSRFFGPVPTDTLHGRVFAIYWSGDLTRVGDL